MVGKEAQGASRRVIAGRFQHFLAIDWSGAKGARHKGIALAVCDAVGGPPVLVRPDAAWSREEVLAILTSELPPDTLVGIDLGISFPFDDAGAFFPGWNKSPRDAKALWALIDEVCSEDDHLAASSFVSHPEASQYFRHGKNDEGDRFHLAGAETREGRFRAAEHAQRRMGCRPVSNFNLVGAAQVGKSSLTGMRMLHRLSGTLPVWPVDPLPANGSVLVEIYTQLAARQAGVTGSRSKLRSIEDLNTALAELDCPPVHGSGAIDDHSADALLTAVWLRTTAPQGALWHPTGLTPEIACTEGWTFGATYDAPGPWSFEILTSQGESDSVAVLGGHDDYEAYQIGAARDLGPGVSWNVYAIWLEGDQAGTIGTDLDGTVIGTAINLSF